MPFLVRTTIRPGRAYQSNSRVSASDSDLVPGKGYFNNLQQNSTLHENDPLKVETNFLTTWGTFATQI